LDHNQFLAAIESYYEQKYVSEIERRVLKAHLAQKSPDELDALFKKAILAHPKKWKSLPDITIFTDDNDTEHRAEQAWRLLQNISDSYDVVITDPVSHFVVSGFGSWFKFCEARDGEYSEVTHKDFVRRYVSAVKHGVTDEPRLLGGAFRESYGNQVVGIPLRIVGDEAAGRAILESANTPRGELMGAIKQLAERKAQ
jgi:hypothetical protein